MRPRTSRLHMAIPVSIYGYSGSGIPFKEVTETIIINANGGLVELSVFVAKDQQLFLVNTDQLVDHKVAAP